MQEPSYRSTRLRRRRPPRETSAAARPLIAPPTRPWPITLLALLQLLGSLLLLFGAAVQRDGLFALYSTVLAATACGMLLGRQWGWRWATVYYANTVLRNAKLVASLLAFTGDPATLSASPEFLIFKHIFRAILYCLLLAYLFKGTVQEYFDVDGESRLHALKLMIVLNVAVFLVPPLFQAR